MDAPVCFKPKCDACDWRTVCGFFEPEPAGKKQGKKKRAGDFDKKAYNREYYKTYKRKDKPAGRSTGDVEHERQVKVLEKLEGIDKRRKKAGGTDYDKVSAGSERERA
jgi:hypothetical protein